MDIRRTRIADALKSTAFGEKINVKGWVRTKRGNKNVNFIALNDGSTINSIQIVADVEKFEEETLKSITTGACISVIGTLTESLGGGQSVEILAENIEIYGLADNTYPLQKKGHTIEFLREIAHLRPRTNLFGAVLRLRHNMAMAIHTYFHQKGYYYFHTPIITASDCEGAGQMFQVTTQNLYNLKKDEEGKIDYSKDFFGKETSLTVSGQLQGETFALAYKNIYCKCNFHFFIIEIFINCLKLRIPKKTFSYFFHILIYFFSIMPLERRFFIRFKTFLIIIFDFFIFFVYLSNFILSGAYKYHKSQGGEVVSHQSLKLENNGAIPFPATRRIICINLPK